MKKLTKYILCQFILLSVCLSAWAESAIVHHADGTISNYDGSYSYYYAVGNAADGDTILISSGNFVYGYLAASHCVVRGSGCGAVAPDASADVAPTRVEGGWPCDGGCYNQIEGIRFTGCAMSGEHNTFSKCWFESMTLYYGSNNAFVDCVFQNLNFDSDECVNNSFHNSLFLGVSYEVADDNGSRSFSNCVFVRGCAPKKSNATLTNCILYEVEPREGYWDGASPFYSNQCKNCLMLTSSDQNFFANAPESAGNVQLSADAVSTIFQDFDGTNEQQSFMQLTNSARTSYTDAFGEQIGLYGGLAPYSMKVKVPVQIVDMYVVPVPADQEVEVRARIFQVN